MGIKAVVFDVGGVLEITPDLGVGARWENRLGLPAGEVDRRMADVWTAGEVGQITESDVRTAFIDRLGMTPDQAEAMSADFWAQYLGTANTELVGYARGLRPKLRTGILSNSFVGAREREQAAYGFEDLVDEIVYSHEVGMRKPDPEIFALTGDRLKAQPGEMVFVDDWRPHVDAARAAGLHAVHHEENIRTIREVNALLAGGQARR
jgi:epoxide hydrolase-like predicted phosphatase